MFIPFKYGLERAVIDTDEFLIKCPSCETHQWAELLISSVYAHVYFIPIYPSYKDAFVCCKKCGLKRYEVPFNEKLIDNYQEIKNKYRNPWHTYAGTAILAFPFLVAFILWLLEIIKK